MLHQNRGIKIGLKTGLFCLILSQYGLKEGWTKHNETGVDTPTSLIKQSKSRKHAKVHKHEKEVTVMETLVAAYRNHPSIKEARALLRAMDEKVTQALSGWRPTLTATMSASLTKSILSGSAKDGDNTSTFKSGFTGINTSSLNAAVSLKQNLYRGGKTVADTLVAENQVLSQRAQTLSAEEKVLLAAITAHIDVIYRREDRQSLERYLHNVKEALRSARDKFNVGEETKTAVAQAEAVVDNAKANLDVAGSDLATAEAIYEQVTGMRPGKLQHVNHIPNMPATLQQAIKIAKEKNTDIETAKHDEAVARNQIDSARSGLYPSLDFEGQTDRSATLSRNHINPPTPTGVFGPGLTDYSSRDRATNLSGSLILTVPIYEAGLIRSQTREAYQTAESKRVAIHRFRQQAIQDTTAQWSAYKGYMGSAQQHLAETKAYEISVEGTRQEVLVGSKILLDILNEEQKKINASRNEIQARRNAAIAGYTLILKMGQLTAQELKLRAQRYDMEGNYREVRNAW